MLDRSGANFGTLRTGNHGKIKDRDQYPDRFPVHALTYAYALETLENGPGLVNEFTTNHYHAKVAKDDANLA